MVAALALASWGCSSSGTTALIDAGSEDGSIHGDANAGPDTSGGGGDGGGGDAGEAKDGASGKDAAGASDAGSDARRGDGDLCNNVQCTGGDVCCAIPAATGGVVGQCMASCPDGGAPVSCDGPEECSSGTVCCGSVTTAAGAIPNCPVVTASASCVTTCTNNIALQCPGTTTARRCHASADCAGDSANPLCCTFQQSGQTLSFCTSQLLADLASGTCN